jgi:hypothetical protein
MGGYPDPGVAYAELKPARGARAPVSGGHRPDRNNNFPLIGELHCVVEKVDQDLTQTRQIADYGGGNIWLEFVCEIDVFARGRGRRQPKGALNACPEIEFLLFQI